MKGYSRSRKIIEAHLTERKRIRILAKKSYQIKDRQRTL